jgi:hypothetical protein
MSRKKTSDSILKSGGNIPVVASIIVLVAFIAGLLLGSLVVAKSVSGGVASTGNTFAAGWNAAKAKLKAANLPGMFMFGEVKSLAGQVKSVDGNKIVFAAALNNPLWDASLKERTAVIGSETIITIRTQPSPEAMQASQQKAQKEMADLRTETTALNVKLAKCAPAQDASSTCGQEQKQLSDLQTQLLAAQRGMFAQAVDTTGSASDIAVGDNISVVSDSDISEAAQFTPKQIVVNKSSAPAAVSAPAVPAAPPAAQ